MKCVFTLNDANQEYIELAKVLTISALLNSDVDLVCLYDGQENEFTNWLDNRSVPYYKWGISFFEDIKERYKGKRSLEFCAGTYLRLEIPKAFEFYGIQEDYVLFVDVDTIFLNNINLKGYNPKCFAAPPDWDISTWSPVSTGVMLINVKNLMDEHDGILKHLKKHNFDFDFAGVGPCSQGAWNTYFKEKWERLEPEYDWKPWWGFNPNAKIVHFSGPKPKEVKMILSGKKRKESDLQKIHRSVVESHKLSYLKYLKLWYKYFEISNKI